jgi:molybdopterin synthase catalytic subunit
MLKVEITLPWANASNNQSNPKPRYKWENGDYNLMRGKLREKNLTHRITGLDPSDQWDKIKTTLNDLCDRHVPKRKVAPSSTSRKRFRPLWANDKALDRVKAKKAAWKCYLDAKDGTDSKL